MGNKDTQLMQITSDEQLIKTYQSLYYAMNAKPDSRSKLFGRDVVISMQDLKNLNYKITEKFKTHYADAGFRINVNVNFKDRECLEFDSWTTFESYDLSLEKEINSILIVWEYNAQLPGYKLPQKHTLTVRLADELRPEEMLNLRISGKLEEVDKIDQEVCPVIARVDFINPMLGDELLRIVEVWQERLMAPSLDNSKLYKTLKKYSRVIAYIINYSAVLVAIYCSVQFITQWIQGLNVSYLSEISIETTGKLVYILVYSGVFCSIVYKVFNIVASILFANLRSTSNNHTFNITNGDHLLCQKIEKKLKKTKFKIIGNISFTLLFNVLCNLISNCIISGM